MEKAAGGDQEELEPRESQCPLQRVFIYIRAYGVVKRLGLGRGCAWRPQPEDHLQAQEDKVHIKESTAQSDQQAAEGAEAEQ